MKKKRIGILTFHRSINYGAFLQCYSLSNNLAKLLPDVDVEVIDYCPQFEMDKYSPSFLKFVFGGKENRSTSKVAIKNAIKVVLIPDLLKDKRKLKNAFDISYESLKLSKEQWITDDFQSFWSDISGKYDIIIVGSDAVWETRVFPFPNAYFLDESVQTIRMSYAACTGRMSINDYNNDDKKMLERIWKSYNYIGVRDVSTELLVSEISKDITIHHNCDPSIVLDMDKDNNFAVQNLFEKFSSRGIDLEKPIIGIMGGHSMGKMIREFWDDKYQIVAVYYPNKYADCYLSDLTPFEWARVFSFFKITFTRYFHGTIFSLKNLTPTISIDDWMPNYEGQLSKLEDLLKRLGLTDHYFKVQETYSEEGRQRIKKIAEHFIINPDTNNIIMGLSKEATSFNDFKSYLFHALGEK